MKIGKIKVSFESKKFYTFLLFLLCIMLAIAIYLQWKQRDKVPPVISFDSEVLMLTKDQVDDIMGKNYECLLYGMTAWDENDGDVTARIVVYSVDYYEDNLYAIIHYRALDKQSNVASAERIAYLRSAASAFNKAVENEAEAIEYIYEKKMEEAMQGFQAVEGSPELEMEKRVTLHVGDMFNPMAYVIRMEDDKDSREMLETHGMVDGDYNMNEAGVYAVVCRVQDSDGNESLPCVIILTVLEEE